jgi:NUMOD4 motif
MTEWAPVKGFDDYWVSDEGHVRRESTDRTLAEYSNQEGIVMVGLFQGSAQSKRTVARLVAEAFLDEPVNINFDTPIHLDGDKRNNHVENLMWRPRWFAVRYHKQFPPLERYTESGPVVDIESHRKFDSTFDAATTHGLLAKEIVFSIINGSYTFPTFQTWRWWED